MEKQYDLFLEKFKPKKTTDDCYTPDNIYNAVASWVENEYGVNKDNFVRPFYPGGDYERYEYKSTDIVVDNPPFSIMSQIIRWFNLRNIKYFLFAPSLTVFSPFRNDYCAIVTGVTLTYENGAKVATSFVTNLEDAGAKSSPTLYKIIAEENKKNERKDKKELPKYVYPNNIVTASDLAKFSKYGVFFEVKNHQCSKISALDEQGFFGKTIFGGGIIVSEKAAAEKAAAEKAAAEKAAAVKWELSEREKNIIKYLSKKDKE